MPVSILNRRHFNTPASTSSVESLFSGAFPAPGAGGSQNLTGSADSAKYVMSTCVSPTVDGMVTAIRFFVPSGTIPDNADFAVGLYSIDPVLGTAGAINLRTWQAASLPSAGAAGTWVTYTLTAPQPVFAGDLLYPFVRTNRYGFSQFVFSSADVPNTTGDLVGKRNLGVRPNGAFTDVSPATNPPPFPSASNNEACYGVDLEFKVWPSAANTGWAPTGVSLTAVSAGQSGTGWHVENVAGADYFYADTNGAVIDGLDIPFPVKVFANNVTIKRSRIRAADFYVVRNIDPPTAYSGLVMQDCELDGLGITSAQSIAAQESPNARFTRCNIHGMASSGPRLTAGTLMEDCYLWGYVHQEPDHEAGCSSAGGNSNGIVIRHCAIWINTAGASNCIGLYHDSGTQTGVTVDQNLVNGGAYGMLCGINVPGSPYAAGTNMVFTNNVFGREYNAECGIFGAAAQYAAGTGNAWSGNVWGNGAAATGSHAVGDSVIA